MAEEHLWWVELGCGLPDPRAALPEREYQAHIAILEGTHRGRRKQREEEERRARKRR